MVLLPFLLGAALLSGCTTVQEMPTKAAFLVNDPPPASGPTVTLRQVQETMPADQKKAFPYQADATYLGKGLSGIAGYGPVPILPFAVKYTEFHADNSRTNIVRAAVHSRLQSQGIPSVDQAEGSANQSSQLPEDQLSLSFKLRELNVDTERSFFFTLIIDSFIEYDYQVAHVVLECQLMQEGQAQPLWEGTVEGRSSTKEFKDGKKFQHANVLGEAVFAAVDQCLKESGLTETRAKLSSQRYDKLMKRGHELTAAGDSSLAMVAYVQASASSQTPEQEHDTEEALWGAFAASAKRWLATTPRPAMSDEALTYKALAKDASKREDFAAARAAYGKALEYYPMWPNGHYDAAVLAAEAKDYKLAAYHMRRYLVLAPDAKDADAAKEQLLLWQHKAKNES